MKKSGMKTTLRRLLLVAATAMALLFFARRAEAKTITYKGKFKDGATYLIQVPSNWNQTLVLYSHGYVIPDFSNPAEDVGDPITGNYLLANGYALAGSSYATTGWAIQQALPDQLEVLSKFSSLVAKPQRTIAWGHSLGGMVTAGLIQRDAQHFDAALPMCGVVAGGVGTWNQALDSAFAFYTLLASGSGLELVNIKHPNKNVQIAESALSTAQNTAVGKARIALSAALADTPGWFDPLLKEPPPTDYAKQEANQYSWLSQIDFPFAFDFRAELEGRAGGNPSWNNGIDYRKQLQASVDYAEVKALYKKAGLDLDTDLEALNSAVRIKANSQSLNYLKRNLIFNGEIGLPVLTLHTKGDGLVEVENEDAYKQVVGEAGNGKLLRQLFVDRAGHCEFTPAETLVAFQALLTRLDTGDWPDLDSGKLNRQAKALGAKYNVLEANGKKVHVGPKYFKFKPAKFLRRYDTRHH